MEPTILFMHSLIIAGAVPDAGITAGTETG